MSFADVLECTYFHRVSAWRPVSETEEATVCEDVPCGLSRRAVTSAPVPAHYGDVMPEAAYRLTVYTRPEQPFRLGDRLEIAAAEGETYHGFASDSFRYDSHCVTVLEVLEVKTGTVSGAPGGTQRSGSAGERTSIEVSELSAEAGSEGYGDCEDETHMSPVQTEGEVTA